MGWSPDVIAGVTIAIVLAVIGWGGTAYCWWHKKHKVQGEVSTVDKWLSKKGTAGAGIAGAHAGFAETGTELERRPRRSERDLEGGEGGRADGHGHGEAREVVVEGVDNTGRPRAPPPVYSPAERRESAGTRHPEEVPSYSAEDRA
jgi:hypothetical protein